MENILLKHRSKAGQALLTAARIETECAANPRPSNVFDHRIADDLKEQVRMPLPDALKEIGAGGELLPYDGPCKELGTPMEADVLPASLLRSTVRDPHYVTVDANRHRLELAHQAGVLELGLDVAETIEAGNSLEKMLAHQLAATHRVAMKMTARLNEKVDALSHIIPDRLTIANVQALNVEACRLAGAISRLTGTFQHGMLTLQRLRTGGRQVVTVQHVNVNQGGQAVVAGHVDSGGRGSANTGASIKNGQ
jgi:hypothetical protein